MLLLAAIVLALAIPTSLGAGLISPANGTSRSPDGASVRTAGSLASWNPNVACTADPVTIADVLGPAYPSQSLSGGRYQRNNTTGGVPHPRALSPPCTMTNFTGEEVSTLVQINGVYLSEFILQPYDCSDHYKRVNGGGPYPDNQTICEYQGTILAMGTTQGFLQIEFDQDWLAKGYCGAGVSYCDNATMPQYMSNGTVSLDVQGFVYWDGENWELHPFTAWRPTPPPPDFGIAADPSSMSIAIGSSGSSTITLTGLNGFSGTLDLSVSVSAIEVPPLLPTTSPTASVEPGRVVMSPDGGGTSTLTITAALLTTPGTYAVTVTATDGSITHSVTVMVRITLV